MKNRRRKLDLEGLSDLLVYFQSRYVQQGFEGLHLILVLLDVINGVTHRREIGEVAIISISMQQDNSQPYYLANLSEYWNPAPYLTGEFEFKVLYNSNLDFIIMKYEEYDKSWFLEQKRYIL